MNDTRSRSPGTAPHAPDAKSNHARKHRRRKAGLWSLLSLAVLAGAMGLFVLSHLGAPITVPDWLRARITARINDQAGGFQVELGSMAIVLDEGWTPRLALRAVTVRGPDRRVIATLAELGGTARLRPLLQGQVQPGSIRLSGLQVHLRRDDAGSLGVRLGADIGMGGGLSGSGAKPRDVPSLIALIDEALEEPALASLESVRADNMTLRYEDARTGRAWTVDGGSLGATREDGILRAHGDFTVLGARSYASTLRFAFSSRIGSTAARMGLDFTDLPADELALQSPALAVMGALNAPISGSLRARLDTQGALGPLAATLQIGQGVLQPNPATKPIAFDAARASFTYDPGAQTIRLDDLIIDSAWVTASAEGTAHLIGGAAGWPEELQAQLRVSEIIANPADLYEAPVRIDGAALDLRLQLDPFHLSLGQLSLSDQGKHLVLSGELRGSNAGWDLALNGRMDGISRTRLMQLWPAAAVTKTHKWVDENVQKADLRNIDLALRVRPGSAPVVALSFAFADLRTRFLKQMPPIQDGAGKAVLIGNRFAIEAEKGRVKAPEGGWVDIAGTSFVVPDIKQKPAPAEVALHTSSLITAALSLIDQEPFRFLSKQNRPVTLAEGRARVAADLAFPLRRDLKTEDVSVDVSGRLTDLSSDVVVPGRVLTADALDLRLAQKELSIGGDGKLDGIPFSGHWKTALGPEPHGSRVEGTIALSQAFADAFGIGLPPGSFTGSAMGRIALDLGPEGAADFTLTSDLAGLGLSLPQLSWSLGRDAKGTLEVKGRLGAPPRIDRLSLKAPGLNAEGRITLKPDGQLDRAQFSRVKVGGWLDGPISLVGRGKGVPPRIEMTGGSIDLRRAKLGESSGGAGGPLKLALDRLTVTDALELTAFHADLDLANGMTGRFTGRVNDGAPVRGQIVPQEGRSAFRVTADDAGGVLRSAGLLKQARGGHLELILKPAGAPSTFEGSLQANNIWLTDAPSLAALLSAISVVGLLEQMSGSGIHFSDVDARFRLGPERLTLYSGSAVGASMGLSMDGYYDLVRREMDMQGVVSPIYLVNAIGAMFTRKGEGLVGVNYTLKGPVASPRVAVNPLSLLTPGMFREIFRRTPPRPPARAPARAAPEAASPTPPAPVRKPPMDRGRMNR
ncbi:MAG: AsmA-like C-terminal region-containing protein [Rhodobacterales bacterium]|nr:AsmA-like C-terminal region-containing protein [Rhodobacterales bacterium]